jgi:hypothetical protein
MASVGCFAFTRQNYFNFRSELLWILFVIAAGGPVLAWFLRITVTLCELRRGPR